MSNKIEKCVILGLDPGIFILKNHIMNSYYVYIMTNESNSVLYVGMTNDLKRRVFEHKNKLFEGFTKKYNINKLVYFEETSDVKVAIQREKNIKKWNRQWKIDLIKTKNPEFQDLYELL